VNDARKGGLVALTRISFGPSSEELLAAPSRFDLARHVEEQLNPESIADAECERRIGAANLGTLNKPLRQLWADYRVAADKLKDMIKAAPDPGPSPENAKAGVPNVPNMPNMQDEQHLRQLPARETEIATWLKAVYSRRQLQEVLADFWHNHFNVFAWENQISPVFAHYDREVIRKHLLGNFREMLEAVAKSPAMSIYLDGFLNQSGNPNENYARELFELHTLGAENYLGTRDRAKVAGYALGDPAGYVDGDVYEAARCFTGWRVDANQKEASNSGEFAYYDGWHDRFQKIVLGRPFSEYQPPLKDGHDVLDLLSAHHGTARYVCRKLCRRFVADEPSERLVQACAKLFHEQRKAPDQLRQVVRLILLSKEFGESPATKLKRPFESTAGILRATGAEFSPTEPFLNNYQRAGQRLFAWRSPDGYPDTRSRWGGTSVMVERWRLANQLVSGHLEGVKLELLTPEGEAGRDPRAASAHWSRRMLGRVLPAPRLKAIESFLAKDPANPERMRGAVALLFMSPEYLCR
jgi:uncharacterized protein (DUF1800 family)